MWALSNKSDSDPEYFRNPKGNLLRYSHTQLNTKQNLNKKQKQKDAITRI